MNKELDKAVNNGDWSSITKLLGKEAGIEEKSEPFTIAVTREPKLQIAIGQRGTGKTLVTADWLNKCFELKIKNGTKDEKEVVLFGANWNEGMVNFGNPVGVSIESDTSYDQFLMLTKMQQIEVNKLRVQASDSEQLKNNLKIRNTQPSGMSSERRVNLDMYRSPLDYNPDIIEAHENFVIDANTEVQFKLMPKADISITFFPKKSLSAADKFVQFQKGVQVNDPFSNKIQADLQGFSKFMKIDNPKATGDFSDAFGEPKGDFDAFEGFDNIDSSIFTDNYGD